jgi:hypothetical protein
MVAAITSSASLRFSCACSARTFAATLAKLRFRRAQACSYTVPVGVGWVTMRRGRGFQVNSSSIQLVHRFRDECVDIHIVIDVPD